MKRGFRSTQRLGQYERALEDYNLSEAMNPAEWQEDAMGLLSQVNAHARLGDEASALACCARLPDDFWTPGIKGEPARDKQQIADEVRRIVSAMRQRRV